MQNFFVVDESRLDTLGHVPDYGNDDIGFANGAQHVFDDGDDAVEGGGGDV